MHERQIQAILRSTFEVFHDGGVVRPVFLPGGFPEADLFGEGGEETDVDGVGGVLWEERTDTVVEVGK